MIRVSGVTQISITAAGADRLRQVQTWLQAIPAGFDMSTWVCGTGCCIAGKAAVIAGFWRDAGTDSGEDDVTPLGREACEALSKLDNTRRNDYLPDVWDAAVGIIPVRAAAYIFYVDYWPDDLSNRYHTAKLAADTKGMCEAGAERIERFLTQEDVTIIDGGL